MVDLDATFGEKLVQVPVGQPVALTNSTACSRNSAGYLLGRPIRDHPSSGTTPKMRVSTEPGQLQSKHDLRARPIYHHKRESIQAHLNIVFAALAVTRFIEDRTGWSIKRFVRTTRRYRTVQIRAGQHLLTAEDPLPPDLRDALAQLT